MEAMDFDPDTLLTCAGSDPMLGKVPDPTPASSGSDLSTLAAAAPAATSASAPSGSFIVLKNSAAPGVLGRVTQLGNINLSSLAPGQGARAASSRLTAVMGRAAGSTSGALTKFIISPSSQAPGSAVAVSAAPSAPGQHHVRMVSAGAGVRLVPGAVSHQFRPLAVDQLASPTKTITLTTAQAQQMGLFSPKKMSDGGVRTVASPQRIVIKSSPSLQSKQVAVSASSGAQSFRVLAQSSTQQSMAGRQGVQFVRVVGSAAGPTPQSQYVTPAAGPPPTQDRTLPAAGGGSNSVKIAIAPSQSAQRLLLPAAPLSAGLDQMRSDVTPSPAGRPANRAAGAARQRVVQSSAARSQVSADTAHRSQISASMRTQPTQAVRVPGRGDGAPLIRPRKPCNCTKSQCLKLYCDCFASGEFCNNCNCNNCNNSLDHEEERQRAIRACLDRNPYAFKPKIGKSDNETRKHQKGCNCKKSGCLKNYCECYEAKINCSSQCKCIGCKNSESAPSRQGRPGAGAAGSIDEDLSFLIADGASIGRQSRRSKGLKVATFPVPDRSPLVRVTQDVIDATLQCLMAESCEPGEPELRVLNEFGRCISQIIDYGSRRGDPLDGVV